MDGVVVRADAGEPRGPGKEKDGGSVLSTVLRTGIDWTRDQRPVEEVAWGEMNAGIS